MPSETIAHWRKALAQILTKHNILIFCSAVKPIGDSGRSSPCLASIPGVILDSDAGRRWEITETGLWLCPYHVPPVLPSDDWKPCLDRKCVSCGKPRVIYRVSDGDHQDHQYQCLDCHKTWWIDGCDS